MPERAAPSAATWDLVATVREPTALVLAFAAHHLALGANCVWLFFDDPEDPCAALATQLPRTRVIRCDAEYWRTRQRERPALQSVRQLANATWASNRSEADWMLHLDADELLWCAGPLDAELARLDDSHGWLKIRNLERVWIGDEPGRNVFEGRFRVPVLPRDDIDLTSVYGDDARYLKMGFAGYPIGKALSRTGRGYRLHVHGPRGPEGMPAFREARRVHILHFDGLTPRHWAAKTLRYAAASDDVIGALLHAERQAQVRYVRDACRTMDDVLAFHRRLLHLDTARRDALQKLGKLVTTDVHPVSDTRQWMPDAGNALAPGAFDASLGPVYGQSIPPGFAK